MKKTILFFFNFFIVLSLLAQNGPWQHKVFRATSVNGIDFVKDSNLLFFPASVPGAVVDTSGNVYVYYVYMQNQFDTEQLKVSVSNDGEYFDNPLQVVISGSIAQRKVDPCAVLLPDGRIRLYYINFDDQPSKELYSAISNDGIHFTEEPGIRFYDPDGITDPDVFKTGGIWNMYLSKGPELIRAVSTDGLVFTQDSSFLWDNGSVSSSLEFSCGLCRTYFCNSGISSATSGHGEFLTPEQGIRISAEPDEIICDPSIIRLLTGGFIMYYKSASISSDLENETCICNGTPANFPNPFTDYTQISIPELLLSSPHHINIEVYNSSMILVDTKVFPAENTITYTNTNLAEGIYYYKISAKNQTNFFGKFIKINSK